MNNRPRTALGKPDRTSHVVFVPINEPFVLSIRDFRGPFMHTRSHLSLEYSLLLLAPLPDVPHVLHFDWVDLVKQTVSGFGRHLGPLWKL